MKKGYIDKLTYRFYLTKQLRPNELGLITIGTGSNPYSEAIPPNMENFVLETFCHSYCIEKVTKKKKPCLFHLN